MKPGYVICDECKGNGFVRVPYAIAKEEITVNCDKCSSEGEIREGYIQEEFNFNDE